MTKTLPEISSKVRTAYKNADSSTVYTDEVVDVLGSAVTGHGAIGVRYPNGDIAVLHHVDDLMEGAIGWAD